MIPQVYYENAYMEGAGERNILCSILLPMMKPVIKMNVLLAVMNAFKCYREAFLLGGRHPDDSIYLLQHFMNNNFENLNYQKIASASVVLMGSVLLFVLLDALIGLVRRRNDVGKTV